VEKMADILYGSGGDLLASGGLDWVNDTLKVQLLDSGYVVDLTAHNTFDQVTPGARVSTANTLTNPTLSEGKLDGDDVVFTAVGGGGSPPTLTQYVLYKDTGLESTSTLIAYFDSATGLPLLTNGGDITIQFDALGIVQL
jgi:hypothetical protein